MKFQSSEMEYESRNFMKAEKEFFKDLFNVFCQYVGDSQFEGYPEYVLTAFMIFNRKTSFVLDFEVYLDELRFCFIDYRGVNFTKKEWISIYGLFKDVLKYNNRLNTFIYLFLYDLIFIGPFGEDIEALDMSDELLSMMGEDMLMLYNLFDDYFNTRNEDLLEAIVEASKHDTIPYFVVKHLADWFNEYFSNKKKFGDLICELYAVALEKIYKKPEFLTDEITDIGAIRYELDTSGFSEKQIENAYSKLENKNIYFKQ